MEFVDELVLASIQFRYQVAKEAYQRKHVRLPINFYSFTRGLLKREFHLKNLPFHLKNNYKLNCDIEKVNK